MNVSEIPSHAQSVEARPAEIPQSEYLNRTNPMDVFRRLACAFCEVLKLSQRVEYLVESQGQRSYARKADPVMCPAGGREAIDYACDISEMIEEEIGIIFSNLERLR